MGWWGILGEAVGGVWEVDYCPLEGSEEEGGY